MPAKIKNPWNRCMITNKKCKKCDPSNNYLTNMEYNCYGCDLLTDDGYEAFVRGL